jgi:ATP-dependent DNA helicase RecG
MSHGRKFRQSRRIPETERFLFEQKLTGRNSRTLDRTDVINLIRGGEDTHLEFKIRLVNTEKITAEIVAMANSGGGAMMFGVNDQRRIEGLDDPEYVEDQLIEICRNQIKPALLPRLDKVFFDNGDRIVVLQVDDRRAPHATPDNRYFVRVGSTKREAEADEIAALFAKSRIFGYEDTPLIQVAVEEIDEALVWSYLRDLEGELFREPTGFPTTQVMHDLHLAKEYGGGIKPTLAGVLLFGGNAAVQKAIPQSTVHLTRYSGATLDSPVVEKSEACGNLSVMFDRAFSFLKRYIDVWDARPPKTQNGQPEPISARANYSRDVVIEALTNFLVHRDYSMTNSPSRILVFDDRIEFINARRTNGLTRKSVEYGVTAQHNPRLHHIFTQAEYGCVSTLRGIPALRRAHFAFAKREPRISLLNNEFRLELNGV